MVNLLFIHGLHGSPDNVLVKRLRKHLGAEYNIIAPAIPVNCAEAIGIVEDIRKNMRIDIIVGVSLGGFIALTQSGVPQLVINPCLCPTIEIERLGASNEEAESYWNYEESLASADEEFLTDKRQAVGIFGARDELFGEGELYVFAYRYPAGRFIVVDGGHTLSKETVIETVIPTIHKLVKAASES